MIPRALATIVVELLEWLEQSGDETVNPDDAVRWLENISGTLQEVNHDD